MLITNSNEKRNNVESFAFAIGVLTLHAFVSSQCEECENGFDLFSIADFSFSKQQQMKMATMTFM